MQPQTMVNSAYTMVCQVLIMYYKERKCAVNENLSVHIASVGSKTCDNRPLKNGSAVLIARLNIGS